MLKVGDRLYCYRNSVVMNTFSYTIGKIYIIVRITEFIWVINDDNEQDWFYINDKSNEYSYENWFYTNQEMRKIKLERINESYNVKGW